MSKTSTHGTVLGKLILCTPINDSQTIPRPLTRSQTIKENRVCLSNLYNYSCIKTWNLWKSTKTGTIQFWLWNILTYDKLRCFVQILTWDSGFIMTLYIWYIGSEGKLLLIFSLSPSQVFGQIGFTYPWFLFCNKDLILYKYTCSIRTIYSLLTKSIDVGDLYLFWPVADVQLNNLYKS